MDNLFAICENPNCNSIFPVTAYKNFGAVIGVTFNNSRTGPCPSCGSDGKILDGTYDMIGDVVTFVKGPKSSLETLNQVKHLLELLKQQGGTKQKAVEEISKISPEFGQLAQKVGEPFSYPRWMDLLLWVIGIAISFYLAEVKDEDAIIKNKMIEYLMKENTELKVSNSTIQMENVQLKKKIGRNDPCPCNSGEKYKKCCLK